MHTTISRLCLLLLAQFLAKKGKHHNELRELPALVLHFKCSSNSFVHRVNERGLPGLIYEILIYRNKLEILGGVLFIRMLKVYVCNHYFFFTAIYVYLLILLRRYICTDVQDMQIEYTDGT